MANKFFSEEVEEINNLQFQLSTLNSDREAKAAKAEKLNDEISVMRMRRDELEKIQKNASSMIMDGTLSDDDYCAYKTELTNLYQCIDDKDGLYSIYEKAIEADYPKKYAELQNQIERKRTRLLAKYAQKIAFDIVGKSEPQLKQLLVCFPDNPMRVSQFKELELGTSLIYALEHELDGSKKPRKDPDEKKTIYQNILHELGV